MRLFPVRVMYALGPHLFHDSGEGGVLRCQRHLHMKLKIPFGIAKTLLFTRFFLDFHQLHDVLLGHLSGGEFGNVAFDQLAGLQQLKRTIIGEFQRFIGNLLMFRMIGDNVDTGTFADFNVAFHFQHNDGFANDGTTYAFFVSDKPLCG